MSLGQSNDQPKIGIAGLGVIGGSIGLSLSQKGYTLAGYDFQLETTEEALQKGCIQQSLGLEELASQVDVLFVSVPPDVTVPVLEEIVSYADSRLVLTDCTSVKGPIMEWAGKLGASAPRFVGGHPMAGHEKSGPEFASASMFADAKWILTRCESTDDGAVSTVSELVQELGAQPIEMPAEEHDRHVALLSHVPHILAGELLRLSQQLAHPQISGGSWRDLTRVGGANPDLWTQILAGNRSEVIEWLRQFDKDVQELISNLEQFDAKSVHRFFDEASEARKGH